MMNHLLKNYVEGVAGETVSDVDALEFIHGLEDHNKTVVDYDIQEDGFLVSKSTSFNTLKAAMDFVRRLNSFTRPVIR